MTPTQRLLIRAVDALDTALALLRQVEELTDQDMTGALDYTESACNCAWHNLARENELEYELSQEV